MLWISFTYGADYAFTWNGSFIDLFREAFFKARGMDIFHVRETTTFFQKSQTRHPLSQDHPNEAINRFECIFLADNGSFFVNYIIFGAFLSCGLELLRIPEFLRLAIRLCFTSQLEQSSVKEIGLDILNFMSRYSV